MVGEEIPAFSSPEQHSIEKAKTLYQKYQAIDNNSERASELYDEVKEFVLRDLIFERLWYEQQIQDIVAKDGLHRNKMLTLELKEMTSLIEFFEKLLGDICRKYGFDDTKKRDKYRQEKQERLGLKKRTQVVATVPSFDVPVVAPSR